MWIVVNEIAFGIEGPPILSHVPSNYRRYPSITGLSGLEVQHTRPSKWNRNGGESFRRKPSRRGASLNGLVPDSPSSTPIARVLRGPDVPIADVPGHRSQFLMSKVLGGLVDVSKAEVSLQHLRSRSETSSCHTAPTCRSGSFASAFSASVAPFFSHPSNRPVPRAFSETAFASVLRRE